MGVAVGLLVGVGLALLLAPDSGDFTRRRLRRRLRRGLRRIRGRGEDAWDDLRLELRKARRQLRRARLIREDAASAVEAVVDPV